MTAPPQTAPVHCSALQLAWLQELGIERPWLPSGAETRATAATAGAMAGATPGAISAGAIASATANAVAGAIPGATTITTPSGSETADDPKSFARNPATPAPIPVLRMNRAPAPGSAGDVKSVPGAASASADGSPARAADPASCPDLGALAASIAACQSCGLCASRHHVVVGAGVVQPAIMVIGEAPGEQEDRQGLPFVGRSGMLLDNMLSAIGASRDTNVYVANAIKCRPPGNRNPRPEESAACHPFLLRQIELVNPRAILALGRVAAQALLATDASLQSLRGRDVSFSVAGTQYPVIVSYHPAYLLRRPTEKAAAWQDLQRARAIAAI